MTRATLFIGTSATAPELLIIDQYARVWDGSAFVEFSTLSQAQLLVIAQTILPTQLTTSDPVNLGGYYIDIDAEGIVVPCEVLWFRGAYTIGEAVYARSVVNPNERIADTILCRDWTAVQGIVASASLLNAARKLRNRVTAPAGVSGSVTVYEEDGNTVAYTQAFSADATALPVIEVGA